MKRNTPDADRELVIREQLLDEILGWSLDELHDAIGFVPEPETPSREQRLSYLDYRINFARAAIKRSVSIMVGKARSDLDSWSVGRKEKNSEHVRRVDAVIAAARAAGKKVSRNRALIEVETRAKEKGERGYSAKRFRNAHRGQMSLRDLVNSLPVEPKRPRR